jgi:hypothetical protein
VRVIVASSFTPFAESSRQAVVRPIIDALRSHRHQTDELWLPVDEGLARWPQDGLLIRLTDVSAEAELLIAVGPVATLLEHPRMVVWWDAADAHWLDEARGPAVAVHAALRAAHRLVSSSSSLTERLRDRLGVSAATIDPRQSEPEAVVDVLVP